MRNENSFTKKEKTMLHAHRVNFLKVSTHRLSCPKHYNGGRKKNQDVISVRRWVPAAWRPAGGGSDGCRHHCVSLLPFNLCWGNWYSYIIPHFKLSGKKKERTPSTSPTPRKKEKKQESRCDFYALLSVSDNNLRQRKWSRTDWHHNADSGSVILCGRSR